jgi:hypothetical protein
MSTDNCIFGVPQTCTPGTPTAEVCDGLDNNCDGTVDAGFVDTDVDGLADCIDPDDDNDTILDPSDNCPLISNTSQNDLDGDSQGDVCDSDADGDGFEKTSSGSQALAGGEISVAGVVSGSYLDTHASDDLYEEIQEVRSGGPPSQRFSFLEHKWTFTLSGSSALNFNLGAYHTANSEGDDVLFSYSADDVTYTEMFTLTKTSDDDFVMSFSFPAAIAGTLYVRAVDADQTVGNNFLDDLIIDQMYVELEGQLDCDDLNADVFPGNTEICDSLDNDCDGTTDGVAAFCPGSIPPTVTVNHGTGPSLVFDWESSCSAAAQDYVIYEGEIGNWYSHTQVDCSDDLGDRTEEIIPSSGNRYYLIVPRGITDEGSYGRDSLNVERPRGASTCTAVQALGECPP